MPRFCAQDGLYARFWARQSGGFIGLEEAPSDRAPSSDRGGPTSDTLTPFRPAYLPMSASKPGSSSTPSAPPTAPRRNGWAPSCAGRWPGPGRCWSWPGVLSSLAGRDRGCLGPDPRLGDRRRRHLRPDATSSPTIGTLIVVVPGLLPGPAALGLRRILGVEQHRHRAERDAAGPVAPAPLDAGAGRHLLRQRLRRSHRAKADAGRPRRHRCRDRSHQHRLLRPGLGHRLGGLPDRWSTCGSPWRCWSGWSPISSSSASSCR